VATMNAQAWEWSEWWVAGVPDARATGELRFDEVDGATLVLYQGLQNVFATRWRSPTLHGENFAGVPLTLPHPIILRAEHNIGPAVDRTRTRLRSGMLLRGYHADPDSMLIDRAIVQMTGLRELCTHPYPSDPGTFLYTLGSDATRRIDMDGGSLTFRSSVEREQRQFTESSERDVDVLIETNEPMLLDTFHTQWIDPLEALILFAARAPIRLKGITLLLNDPGAADAIHPAIRHGTSREIWNETHVELPQEAASLARKLPAKYDRPLVPFNALGNNANDFLARWWKLYHELGSAAGFLTSALGSELFLENRLLNETTFLEGYHRIKHDSPVISAEDHTHNVTKMLEAIEDDEQRNHYALKLQHAEEQNARTRFRAMVRRARDTLDVSALDKKLVEQLMNARIANTHLGPDVPTGPQGVDLVYAVALLQVVIETNILLDLRLDKEKVADLVHVSYRHQMPIHDFRTEDRS